jgi:hypothetical protein
MVSFKPRLNPLASVRGKKDSWADGVVVRIDLGNPNFQTISQTLSKMGRVVKKIIYLSERFSPVAAKGRVPLPVKAGGHKGSKPLNDLSKPARGVFTIFTPAGAS